MSKIASLCDLKYAQVAPVIRKEFDLRSEKEHDQIKRVADRYEQGDKLSTICKDEGISDFIARQYLEEYEVTLRPALSDNMVNFFDEKFFSKIDTSAKAYWLGFLFADGCVAAGRYVTIKLSSRDRNHIEKFMDAIDYSGVGIKDVDNGTKFGASYLTLESKQMVSDLISRGCVPNKSQIISAPQGVPKKFYRDFVRGVCDGDGYLRDTCPCNVEICGSHNLMLFISDQIGGIPRPHRGVYRISLHSRNALNAIEYMYKDAEDYLERKMIVAESAMQQRAVTKRTFVAGVEDDIINDSLSGLSVDELVEKYDSSSSTIYRVLGSNKDDK